MVRFMCEWLGSNLKLYLVIYRRLGGRVFGSSFGIMSLFSSRTFSIIGVKDSIRQFSSPEPLMIAMNVDSPFLSPFTICIADRWVCPSLFDILTRGTKHDPSLSISMIFLEVGVDYCMALLEEILFKNYIKDI